MPTALKDIMKKHVAVINAEIKKGPAVLRRQFPQGIEDKSDKYCNILDEFVSWYMNVRQHGIVFSVIHDNHL